MSDELKHALAAFELNFLTVQDGVPGRLSSWGEPFTVVMSGGVKKEGESAPALCSDPETAVQLWLGAALRFAGGGDILEWRERPMLDSCFIKQCKEDGSAIENFDMPVLERWTVYSRFAVKR